MNEIKQAWNYIAEWLDTVASDYDRNALAEGTTEEELNGFENEFSIELPADFRQSYLMHNGFREEIGLVHGGNLLSIIQIRKRYYRLTHRNSPVDWDKSLLPVVMFNETDFFALHLETQQFYWTGLNFLVGSVETSKLPFESFTEFLTELAYDLKVGNGPMGEMLG